MKMFKIAVCDDDTYMLEKVVKCIEQTKSRCNVEGVVYKTSDSVELLHEIQNSHFDIVVLDIQMPNIDGFDIASHLDDETKLIFISGYDDFVFDVFEYNIHYFIRKKELSRLNEVIEKIFKKDKEKYISFDTIEAEKIKVPANCIVYIESIKNYIEVCVFDKCICKTRKTLKDFDYVLENKRFFKINKGTIINMDYVQKVEDVVAFIKTGNASELKRYVITRNRLKDFKNEFFTKGLTDV